MYKRMLVLLTVVVVLSLTVSFANAGLVAWYPFDGSLNDASGNGLHGAIGQGAVSYNPGKFGQQVTFDGQSGVDVANNALLNPGTGPMSIAFWASEVGDGPPSFQQVFVGKSDGTANGYRVNNQGGAGATLAIFNGAPGAAFAGTPVGNAFPKAANAAAPVLHHIVVTLNDGRWAGALSVWVDGTLIANGTKVVDINNTGPMTIGYAGAFSKDPLDGFNDNLIGSIDDLAIFDHMLTENEIFDIIDFGVVPEPATMTLLGLGALGLIRRRRS